MQIISYKDGLGALTKAAKNSGLHFTVPYFFESSDNVALSYSVINEVPLNQNRFKYFENDAMQTIYNKHVEEKGRVQGIVHQSLMGAEMYDALDLIRIVKPTFVVWSAPLQIISKKNEVVFYDYLSSLATVDYITHYKAITGVEAGMPDGSGFVYFVSILRNSVKSEFKFPTKVDGHEPLSNFLQGLVDQSDLIGYSENVIVKETLMKPDKTSLVIRTVIGSDDKLELAEEGDTIRWGRIDGRLRRVYPKVMPQLTKKREFGTIHNNIKRYFTYYDVMRVRGFTEKNIEDISRFGVPKDTLYRMAERSANIKVAEEIFKAISKSLVS